MLTRDVEDRDEEALLNADSLVPNSPEWPDGVNAIYSQVWRRKVQVRGPSRLRPQSIWRQKPGLRGLLEKRGLSSSLCGFMGRGFIILAIGATLFMFNCGLICDQHPEPAGSAIATLQTISVAPEETFDGTAFDDDTEVSGDGTEDPVIGDSATGRTRE